MVKKYSVPWCFTNHAGHEKEHFFQFPEYEQQKKTLLRFLNRSDAQEFKQVSVCAIHFSDNVINKNEKRFWFIKKLKHVPLIASSSQMFLIGFLRQSKFSENLQRQEYFRKINWKNSRNRIPSQVWMISMKSKWSLWVKVLFSKKEHLQKLPHGIPVLTHFFSLTEALMWKFIVKELWCRCPLNYW